MRARILVRRTKTKHYYPRLLESWREAYLTALALLKLPGPVYYLTVERAVLPLKDFFRPPHPGMFAWYAAHHD